MAEISLIIISFNTKDLLRSCLSKAAKECGDLSAEIIVVDNDSQDGSREMVKKEFPNVILIWNKENLGFGAANNLGIKASSGHYLVLVNSDLLLHPGTLASCLQKFKQHGDVALAGIQLIGSDGKPQASSRWFPTLWRDIQQRSGWLTDDENQNEDTDWVPGAFCLIRANVFNEVGGFDERFFMYYEEVDLCKRIKDAGYRIAYWGDLQSTHLGGASLAAIKNEQISKRREVIIWRLNSCFLYYRKHYGILGAYGSYLFEITWQKLRIIKGKIQGKDNNKITESTQMIEILKKAWKNTEGGKKSPTIPW